MVCTQAAALGGGIAQPFNLSHGPLVGGAYFWLRGIANQTPSLFHALLLNLAPIADIWGNTSGDVPCWEAAQSPLPCKRDVAGIRDLFTFQSRRLHLVVDEKQQVKGVRYNQGCKIEKRLFHDPQLTYIASKEEIYPLRFSTSRALWQYSAAFMLTLSKKGEGGHSPRTFDWLLSYRDILGIDRPTAFSADVFGMVNDQAKVELWRHERVTVYPAILNEVDRWSALKNLIETAQHWHDHRLREATRAFATRVRLDKAWGGRLSDVERGDRDALVHALDTSSRYWPALGQEFSVFLHQIATFPMESLDDVQKKWQTKIRQVAREALLQTLHSYLPGHSVWQATIEAETVLQTGSLYYSSKKTSTV
jgi:CRISPR system Cascade subunit CasA